MPKGPKGEKRPASTAAPKRKKDSAKAQSARFKETARALGCDETPGALDRAFGKLAQPKKK
jgi:hypothetical protein